MTPSEHGSKGRLSLRQRDFAKLVAAGMDENKAMREVGYVEKFIPATLYKLKQNKRVQDLIELYKEGPVTTKAIAEKEDRQRFWTDIMNDPSYPAGVRLEASKLLGKSQGDFVDRKKIETSNKKDPIVLLPNTSPKEWEDQWEVTNDK